LFRPFSGFLVPLVAGRPDFGSGVLPTMRGYLPLQNIHNKWVTAKILVINKLAPEGVCFLRGLLVFDLYIQYSGLDITKMPRGWE
jgi:hypothetical protein